jgi:predicted metal-dependent hydrolase
VIRTKRSDPRERFKKRTRDWAARLDVRVCALTVRKMRNKWASCSTAGRLTFDEALLRMPGDLQDYVIVHELLHVQVPNHGKLWKSLMRLHLGAYEKKESRLRAIAGQRNGEVPSRLRANQREK